MANTGLLRDAKHLIEKISVWLGVTVYLYAIYYTILYMTYVTVIPNFLH